MMTKQNRKSDEITFSEYKKSGRSYVRARQWVTLYEDGRTKTVGSVRVLTPPEIAAAILNRRCYGISADDLIFPGTKKNLLSPSNLNKKLKRWLAEAGITKNLHPHSLCASSGTYLLDHGFYGCRRMAGLVYGRL